MKFECAWNNFIIIHYFKCYYHDVFQIHTNPCFYKAQGNAPQTILAKDQPKILEHGDIMGLLPDKLFFKVVYTSHQDDKSVAIK